MHTKLVQTQIYDWKLCSRTNSDQVHLKIHSHEKKTDKYILVVSRTTISTTICKYSQQKIHDTRNKGCGTKQHWDGKINSKIIGASSTSLNTGNYCQPQTMHFRATMQFSHDSAFYYLSFNLESNLSVIRVYTIVRTTGV